MTLLELLRGGWPVCQSVRFGKILYDAGYRK